METFIQQTNELVQANLTLGLLNNLVEINQEKSVLISPLSISIILSVFFGASSGDTKNELAEFFRERAEYPQYPLYFAQTNNSDPTVAPLIKNAFLLMLKNPKETFMNSIKKVRDFKCLSDNFSDPNKIVETVNTFVSNNTEGKITNFISPENISPDTNFLIAGTIYFRALWYETFDLTNETKIFHVNQNTKIPMQFMTKKLDVFKYYEDLNLQIVGIPYLNKINFAEQFIMYFVVPTERFGLSALLKNMNESTLLTLLKLKVNLTQKTKIILPKFKSESNNDLLKIMKKLFPHTFGTDSSFPAFGDHLHKFNTLIQKTFIEVNENGTEATSSHFIEMGFLSLRPKDNRIVLDQPFAYYIVKQKPLNVIFAGVFYGN